MYSVHTIPSLWKDPIVSPGVLPPCALGYGTLIAENPNPFLNACMDVRSCFVCTFLPSASLFCITSLHHHSPKDGRVKSTRRASG